MMFLPGCLFSHPTRTTANEKSFKFCLFYVQITSQWLAWPLGRYYWRTIAVIGSGALQVSVLAWGPPGWVLSGWMDLPGTALAGTFLRRWNTELDNVGDMGSWGACAGGGISFIKKRGFHSGVMFPQNLSIHPLGVLPREGSVQNCQSGQHLCLQHGSGRQGQSSGVSVHSGSITLSGFLGRGCCRVVRGKLMMRHPHPACWVEWMESDCLHKRLNAR